MIERLSDGVMLDDFERHIELAEQGEDTQRDAFVIFMEFAKFMDENGRRLLLLARTCHQAMERQSKEPV